MFLDSIFYMIIHEYFVIFNINPIVSPIKS